MGQALYRKYRSRSLSEIVGQEHITDTLAKALESGRISHAYLFTGPRGTGKTSIARILAHEVNGLTYKHEDNHIDIIEIDAASNRGIDEIRDLREKVYAAPVSAKYKVYIIEEVHMLTTPAFNALLKTLEEPPEHVIFILATTEAHKLPETIISRTQRHIFRPVALDKVINHLQSLAKSEKIAIDDDALRLIAEHGGGSFRDSISLLDQAGNSGQKIDRGTAEALLGLPPAEQIDSLLRAIGSTNAARAMDILENLKVAGFHAANIARKLAGLLRQEIIDGRPSLGQTEQLKLMGDLLEVAPSHDPQRRLELSILAAIPTVTVKEAAQSSVEASEAKPSQLEETKKTAPIIKREDTPVDEIVEEPKESKKEDETSFKTEVKMLDANVWPEVLDSLKKTHNTLYGVMRMAVPEYEPGLLRLRFQFAFHQKRMNEAKHRAIIVSIIEELTGQAVAIECLHDKNAMVGGPVGSNHPTTEKPEVPPAPNSLATISNIFGGGELLES